MNSHATAQSLLDGKKLKMWNFESIKGSSALKLNLKSSDITNAVANTGVDSKNNFASTTTLGMSDLKHARKNVIQKLINENLLLIQEQQSQSLL